MATAKPPVLSIVIVSYNTRDLTLACLDSIVRETRETSYEIIVVDNASTDGSPAALLAHPAKPTLIALGQNIGFGRANNIAARAAKGRLLLLLNPDTVILDQAIDRLLAFSQRWRVSGIWGGRTRFADGRLNPASAWARMTVWRLFCRASGLTGVFPNSAICNGESYGGWMRDSERNVDVVSGCFLMIEREIWQQLGGFDPDYFMYGEDADLCLRARKLGARPRVTPDATIVHYGGASERVREDKVVKLLAAKATLIQLHFPALTAPLGLALLAAWPLSRWLWHAARARCTGAPEAVEAARVWALIWQRRAKWYHGFETDYKSPGVRAGSVASTKG